MFIVVFLLGCSLYLLLGRTYTTLIAFGLYFKGPSLSFGLATPYSIWEHQNFPLNNPFGPLQPQRSSQPSNKKNKSPYIKKPCIQHIFYIEPHMTHIKDPLALVMEVLPPNWHFLPKAPEKSIKFYKSILIEEKSTRIEDIKSKSDPSVVLYHELIITRFVSCKEWGQYPSLLRTLEGLGI